MTHIKAGARSPCDGAAVSTALSLSSHHLDLERQLGEAVIAARSGNWPAYRLRLESLRASLLEHIAYEEEEVFPRLAKRPAVQDLHEQHDRLRRHLETLGAAAPEHDPDGCLAEIDELAALMNEHHAAEMAADPAYATRQISPTEQPAPLDLRGLQPPEPIVRIFDALERSPGSPLRAILPHEPVPLYALLRERGFRYAGTPRADGGFELLIERS